MVQKNHNNFGTTPYKFDIPFLFTVQKNHTNFGTIPYKFDIPFRITVQKITCWDGWTDMTKIMVASPNLVKASEM